MIVDDDPEVQKRRQTIEARKAKRAATKIKAEEIWKGMDTNARTGVRFGMFPAELMRCAAAEGFETHELSMALMDCAQADGGMRA